MPEKHKFRINEFTVLKYDKENSNGENLPCKICCRENTQPNF